MKYLMMGLALLSTSAFAQRATVQQATFVLDELNNRINVTGNCDLNDPNAPAWCKNLYEYSCSLPKTRNIVDPLDTSLMNKYWAPLPDNVPVQTFIDTARSAATEAERAVTPNSNVTRDQIRLLLEDSKSIMMRYITSTPLIPKAHTAEMAQKVKDTRLRYGMEYVDDLVAYAKSQNSSLPDLELKKRATQAYLEMCGWNGLHKNAFYENGSIVLCPGLVQSLAEFGNDENAIKNALSFTFGHELGHAIGSEEYPEVYSKMGDCYNSITGSSNTWSQTGAELSSDYWGGIVLSERIKGANLTGERAARVVGMAADGWCGASDEHHGDSRVRVNQSIGRHVLISQAMGCPPPTASAPFCSLRGAYSGN